jgi:hypothetical protein
MNGRLPDNQTNRAKLPLSLVNEETAYRWLISPILKIPYDMVMGGVAWRSSR